MSSTLNIEVKLLLRCYLRYVFRAAVFSFLLLEYRHHLETEELEPLIIRNTIPLCMGQYDRTFKSTR